MPCAQAKQKLAEMVGALRHESFYVSGTWVDERLGVYVGWVARRGSFADHMPVYNERSDRCLIFSGEDFPPPGTIEELKQRGHDVCPGPSYLVHLSEEDPRFPVGLNGRFHGLLIDRTENTTVLFNDRYGMHRIYYHQSRDAFYFAAEAKAILTVCPKLRALEPRALGEFITCGCVLENRTLFEDLHVLPPASAWVFDTNLSVSKRTYFDPKEWEHQEPLKAETYYQELRAVFADVLPRYFVGRERIGMSLTGGLDTRMIMAWHKQAPATLPCYSFGSMFRDCQDVVIARRVAKACTQPHQVIPVAHEFLSQFSHYAERSVYLTDGCIDVSHSADLYVNERASAIAPVRMTGNYGGEVLRRVRAFKPVAPAVELFSADVVPTINAANATYGRLLEGHSLSFSVFRQAPWHHYGLLSLEQTQVTLRSPFLDNNFVKTVFRAPTSACVDNDVSFRLIREGDTRLAEIPTDRGVSAHSTGFANSALQNFILFTIKAEYAYDYGMPQWMSRIDHVLSPLRPERLFLGRHKFYHYRLWYRNALAHYVREMLLDPRALSRPYIQSKTVEAMVRSHLRGNRNYTSEIHKLLTLELISRLFIDSK